MKSRYTTIISEAGAERCKQASASCIYLQPSYIEEIEISSSSSRQLYATEAEDYFFYFIPLVFEGAENSMALNANCYS